MTQTPKLNEALAKAQAEFPSVVKSKTAKVTMKSGGNYEFHYADLSDILSATTPKLAANGLAISFLIASEPNNVHLGVCLRHISGEMIESVLPLRIPEGRPQELGSLLTYYRRYLLEGILGISAEEDDDANRAEGNTARIEPKAAKTPTPAPSSKTDAFKKTLDHKIEFAGNVLISFGKFKAHPLHIREIPMAELVKDVDYWHKKLSKEGGLDGTSPAAQYVKYGTIWIDAQDESGPTAYDEAKSFKDSDVPPWPTDDEEIPF